MQEPPLPDRGSALFFDFDGTLTDIAANPGAVCVEPAVPQCLALLARALAGAVAVISGRPVAEIDAQLEPLRLPVAGVHGAERRGADGFLRRMATPELDPARRLIEALVARHPALLLEVKPGALALHFRQAEGLEDQCLATMAEAQRRVEGMALLCGKKVIELKPRRASKGQAVRTFLDEPPFRSRRPWVFGDDVTDEVAFEAALGLGGVAVKVGAGQSLAPYRLADPAALHEWLQRAVLALGAESEPVREVRA
ncbi:MAG: trehalose-phosphatase [Rubrivivax sp.]|nr:trehalose-phosphatase [Rubrivivax sp.]